MRFGVSVKRLRWGLLASAALLVVLVAVFLGYGHYRMRKFGKDILDRGLKHLSEGITYSDSVGGKINYTLHADSGGEVIPPPGSNDKIYALHGVKLDIYSRTDNRIDHIYGKDFEYNSTVGTVKALGEVDMDIQAPTSVGGHNTTQARDAETGEPANIHVKTHGLVYVKRLGVAATAERVDFTYGAMHGSSQGAEFDNERNVLRLLAQVEATGEEHGQPLHMTASQADFDRTSNMARFENIVVHSGERTARADHAITYLRHDSSVERLEGTGGVTLNQGTRQVNTSRLEATFTTVSVVEWMKLSGGVTLADSNIQKPLHGAAREAVVSFDAKGSPGKIIATGGANVEMVDHRAVAPAQGLQRSLSGNEITMNFVPAGAAKGTKSKSILHELHVVGGAKALGESYSTPSGKSTSLLKTSQVAADDLTGEFVQGARGDAELKTLHGKGHTQLQQSTSAGAEQVSTGDTLEAALVTGAPVAASRPSESRIESAVQTGHVTIHSRSAPKPDAKAGAKQDVTTATAERANYDGTTEKLRLTGEAHVSDGTTEMSATSIVVDQPTGNAEAEGNVVATVLGSGGHANSDQASANSQVTHVLAASAKLQHASRLAEFHGTDALPAKLWQGASQVQAANLFLDGEKHTMAARSAASSALIHAVFAGVNSTAKPSAPGKPAGNSVVRVAAQKMDYADQQREATFVGAVRIDGLSGDALSQRAVVFLAPAKAGANTSAAPFGTSAGSVDHLVLSGDVQLEQPARRAMGETLLYTAATGRYVLTGTPTSPPRAVDVQQGTVTGTSLTFGDSGSTIIVAGEPASPKGKGTRVRTETEVRPEGKK